jgi:hypothetical protein
VFPRRCTAFQTRKKEAGYRVTIETVGNQGDEAVKGCVDRYIYK